VDAASSLRTARHQVGWSQRELAQRTGIAQPTIARIESGAADPRLETLSELLRACGVELECAPRPGSRVDRTQLRELLRRTPRERIDLLAADVAGWLRFVAASS
jgi:transcriptional regulator with XRE-family HTH domain